jgi:hypothetical protein
MSSDPKALADLVQQMISARYEVDDSQHPPMIFACRDGSIHSAIELDFDNEQTKTLSIEAAKLHLATNECDGMIFASEGWMSIQNPDEVEKNGFMAASLDPERVEVLMIEASSPGRHITVMQKINRDSSGSFTGLEEIQRHDSSNSSTIMESRFDLFNVRDERVYH